MQAPNIRDWLGHMTSRSPAPSYGPDVSVKPVAECHDVYELLDQQVRPRPSMWARGESLQDLETLLSGYRIALELHSVPEEFALAPTGPFADWLWRRFGWGMAGGWACAIEENLGAGETAMGVFFRLLDDYRAEQK